MANNYYEISLNIFFEKFKKKWRSILFGASIGLIGSVIYLFHLGPQYMVSGEVRFKKIYPKELQLLNEMGIDLERLNSSDFSDLINRGPYILGNLVHCQTIKESVFPGIQASKVKIKVPSGLPNTIFLDLPVPANNVAIECIETFFNNINLMVSREFSNQISAASRKHAELMIIYKNDLDKLRQADKLGYHGQANYIVSKMRKIDEQMEMLEGFLGREVDRLELRNVLVKQKSIVLSSLPVLLLGFLLGALLGLLLCSIKASYFNLFKK